MTKSKLKLLKEEFHKLKKKVSFLLSKEDTTRYNYLQNYLYFAHYPLFSFTESVIMLCENSKFSAAKVLFRTLIEAHINIIYYQLNNSNHKLALSAKESFNQRIKILKDLKGLIQKYKNLESVDSTNLFNKEYLHKTEEWTQRQRQAIIKGNHLKENDTDLDLRSKAIRCDKEFNNNIEKGYFERMYTLQYRYLSPCSHLCIEGLQSFVDKKENGAYIFDDGDDKEELIAEAIGICVAFSKDLYENDVLIGKVIDEVSNVENLLVVK